MLSGSYARLNLFKQIFRIMVLRYKKYLKDFQDVKRGCLIRAPLFIFSGMFIRNVLIYCVKNARLLPKHP